jgi:hypothetical protein
MLDALTSGEVTEVQAYARRVLLPSRRRAVEAAKVAQIVARSAGNKIEWADVWAWFDPDPVDRDGEDDEQSPAEMEAAFGRVQIREAA